MQNKVMLKLNTYVGLIYLMDENQEKGALAKEWLQRAISTYRHSANNGDVHSQYMLGVIYLTTDMISFEDALAWTQKAADEGHPEAEYNLSTFYRDNALLQSIENHLKWLNKSAGHGYPEAQYQLGVLYATGESVEKNDEIAIGWYKKAALSNHAGAMYNYGVMLLFGEGADKDEKTGWHWVELAARSGSPAAQDLLEKSNKARGVATE